jgi:transposase
MGKSITDLSSGTTVGLDLAKHVFQVHCVDASGRVVVAKAIRRNKLLEFFASLRPCLVGLEASGSAHHWAPGHCHIKGFYWSILTPRRDPG